MEQELKQSFLGRELRGLGAALFMIVATTIIAVLLRRYAGILRGAVLYLIPVMLLGYQLRRGAGTAHRHHRRHAVRLPVFRAALQLQGGVTPGGLNFVLFMVVAVVVSHLSSAAKRHTTIARKREQEMSDLYAFSRRLAAAPSATEIFVAIQNHLANLVQRKVVLLGAAETGTPTTCRNACAPRSAASSRMRAPSAPLTTATATSGSFAASHPKRRISAWSRSISATSQATRSPTCAGRIDDALADAAATLERLDVARALNEAKMRSETELLREALIGSVSHELRTPLASILGAATILSNAPMLAADSAHARTHRRGARRG